MRGSEDILEDILLQLEANGVALATAEQARNALRGGGGGVNTDDVNDELGKFDGALETAVESGKQFAAGLGEANTQSGAAVGNFASGIVNITDKMPMFGESIGAAIMVAEKFYSFMNENLQTYKQYNEAGLQASEGMLGLSRDMSTARLEFGQFMAATADYKDVLASMGSDGSKEFAGMLATVMDTQKSMGALNLTNEQMANSMGSFLKQQKDYGVFDKLNEAEKTATSRKYMEDLNSFSKSLGMSVKDLSDKLGKSSEKVEGLGVKMKLMEGGMDEDAAAKSAANLNLAFQSFGDFGTQMGEQLGQFMTIGTLDLDSSIGQLYQTNDQMKVMFDSIREMTMSGEISAEDGAERIRAMMSDPTFVDSIQGSFDLMQKSFGDAAANQTGAWAQSLKRYNANIGTVDDDWTNLMTSFNTSMDGMMSSMSVFGKEFVLSFFNPEKYTSKWFGEEYGKILSMSLEDVAAGIKDSWSTIDITMAYAWDQFTGSIAEQFDAIPIPTWAEIAQSIFPDWMLDIIMDQGELNSVPDITEKLATSVDEYVTDVADNISNAATDVAMDVKDSVSNMVGGMYDSVASWWSKPQAQTVIHQSTVQQKISQVTPVSMPQAVESATDAKAATEQAIIDKLSEIFQPMIEAQQAGNEFLYNIQRTSRNTASSVDSAQAN